MKWMGNGVVNSKEMDYGQISFKKWFVHNKIKPRSQDGYWVELEKQQQGVNFLNDHSNRTYPTNESIAKQTFLLLPKPAYLPRYNSLHNKMYMCWNDEWQWDSIQMCLFDRKH